MQTLLSQQKSYQEVFDHVNKIEYTSNSQNVRDHFSAGERLANEKFTADKNRRNLYIAAFVQKAIGGLPRRRVLDLLSLTYLLKKEMQIQMKMKLALSLKVFSVLKEVHPFQVTLNITINLLNIKDLMCIQRLVI